MVLGAVCNVLDVPFIPDVVPQHDGKPGLRERLWRSKLGEWLARRLGAPERSQLAGASAFRATEAALGVAASELFAALPKEWREQLAELPATVAALEARAAEARADIEVVAALAPPGRPTPRFWLRDAKRRRRISPRASPRSRASVSTSCACTRAPAISRRSPR